MQSQIPPSVEPNEIGRTIKQAYFTFITGVFTDTFIGVTIDSKSNAVITIKGLLLRIKRRPVWKEVAKLATIVNNWITCTPLLRISISYSFIYPINTSTTDIAVRLVELAFHYICNDLLIAVPRIPPRGEQESSAMLILLMSHANSVIK